MKAILITGMSGTGKSTVLAELADRGYQTVDTDYNGWCIPSSDRSEYIWDEPRMTALLNDNSEGPVFISGCVSNQGRFSKQFHAIVLLSVNVETILQRIADRKTNSYGKRPSERDLILKHREEIEPLLRASADIELDGTLSIASLADKIELLLG